MKVLNVTILKSHIEKSKGLIGVTTIYPVHFTTRWGIHTFGVLLPIDVLILDAQNRVVKKAHNLAPNRIFLWPPIHKNVIELPAGEITQKKIALGDTIKLVSVRS